MKHPLFKAQFATTHGESILAAAVSQDLEGFSRGVEISDRPILRIQETEPAGDFFSVGFLDLQQSVVDGASEVNSWDSTAARIQDGKVGLADFLFSVFHGLEVALKVALWQGGLLRFSVNA